MWRREQTTCFNHRRNIKQDFNLFNVQPLALTRYLGCSTHFLQAQLLHIPPLSLVLLHQGGFIYYIDTVDTECS